jgi:DNA-binding CsgD family transcriptional regulator
MSWPLTGRERELRAVGDALDGGSAGGVVIAGPAGVGKTRLAVEGAELAAAQGCEVAWARATRSARAIPLGAFGALLPSDGDGVELLTRARQALADRAAGRRLVLCVDDGHLLDDASAALVHQLVAGREAFAIVGLRPDEPAPDALRALWKDELCARFDLAELTESDVVALLDAALGGPLDRASAHALWEATRGNALFLRELVRHGRARGLLAADRGVWRWRGPITAGARLGELVDQRIGNAGELLDLVALAAPLEVGLLGAEGLGALDALERGELVRRRADGRRRFVDVGHPLYAEAVRGRLTATRADGIRTRLADAVHARGARRGGDLLRVAVWRLEAGAAGDGELFSRAAEQALAAHDAALAERLARAADAPLALGRALAAQGRAAEAQAVFAGIAATDDRERTAVATAAARNLFWGLGRADDADAMLRAAEAAVAEAALRDRLAAQRVRLAAASGRPADALTAAEPLLDDATDDRARTTAAVGAVEALLSAGRSVEAVALADASLPAARRLRPELPQAEAVLLGTRALALRLAGRLAEATALSDEAYALALRRRSAPGTAVEGTSLALIWLARGRVRTALRLARESVALLRDADPPGMLAFALAALVASAAQAGEPETAHEALHELERTPLGHQAFAVEMELARAWGAACGGQLTRARALAESAAALAERRGQHAYAVRALHELCRVGGAAEAAPRLATLAGAVDGPFAPAAAAHAAALVARDGAALLAAAERLAALDALLIAAEAADAAAAAYRHAGRASSARRAAARAARWLGECEGARPPTLLAPAAAAELTPREREIALLASGGASSRQIAGSLVISVRTVDNHLQSAYRKLGIARREDLAGALSRD